MSRYITVSTSKVTGRVVISFDGGFTPDFTLSPNDARDLARNLLRCADHLDTPPSSPDGQMRVRGGVE